LIRYYHWNRFGRKTYSGCGEVFSISHYLVAFLPRSKGVSYSLAGEFKKSIVCSLKVPNLAELTLIASRLKLSCGSLLLKN
jgi:hypothetical protein